MATDKIFKILYLPVQIKKRAFISKLLLGYLSLQYGYSFVIGKRTSVKKIALDGPDGIYLEKDFFGKKSEYFQKFHDRNIKFYALDDEGLVFHDDNEYINRRVDYESLKYMNKIFAWGQRHVKILKDFLGPKDEEKVILAGNPRIDLLSRIGEYTYTKEIELIKRKYNKFILFNSFFALANGIRPIESQIKRLKKMKTNISEEMLQYWFNFYLYQKKLYDLIKEALLTVAEDHSLNLVIRPHPNERVSTWKKTFKNFQNVKITKEYDVFPWIYCADIVIHNSSTTGLEAYLLDKNVIAYKPVSSDEFDLELPNSVSVVVNNVNTLKETIDKMRSNTYHEDIKDIEIKKQIINYHVYRGKKLSSEIILDEFNKNFFYEQTPIFKKSYFDLTINIFFKFLYFINKFVTLNLKNPRLIDEFPPTNKREVKHYLNCIDQYFGFKFKIKIIQLASSCFLVKKIDNT
ncbi:surface carbohydrate biosynthesis protein [Thermodesulfovibrio thiophilus]|uniref:surface carbohydrate biosynthesis protein n=1 Tax=Thermodesulfovibrio thiophilus TaxID=340095 RepID=UPI0003F57CE8|nr:surface carbohydrate biosynthesis protein [Thermodesulfovibrio thiophilus]